MVKIQVNQSISHRVLYKFIAMIALGTDLLAGTVHAAIPNKTASPQTVAQIDVKRYIGQWYEIAHLPMYFQRKCDHNTTANYALKSNGHIEVVNQCQTIEGKTKSSTGDAYATDSTNAKLKVSFLPKSLRWIPFTKGDYWVLKIDDNYQTVLVGGPTTKYLWILSRTPNIDQNTYEMYLKAAQQYGYDTSKLIVTSHQ